MENLVATVRKPTSSDKTITGVGSQVSELVRRQQVGGQIGGSIYGLVWGELSNMLDVVLGMHISTVAPTFNERMYGYMFRLLAINKFEKDITMNMIAAGAYDNGNGDGLPFNANFPLYADIISDYPEFVRGAAANEYDGIDSTRSTDKETLEVTNLYPDDMDIGDFGNKWITENRNSILSKTKQLFQKGKINSLISRFGTKTDGEPDIDFNGKVGYSDLGMSRGRNLRKAGSAGTNYDTNGYNNPYCRVWTHHHQYDNYQKVIRPFVGEEAMPLLSSDGASSVTLKTDRYQTMQKLHTWKGLFEFKEGEDGEWGWKNENKEWSHSVLSQQNGVVNITPKYDEKGTIHTKDCMFSIENLAWKDYDPYTFENALSWEQRGPLGGRIMWFPPYGLSFTENTNVSWNENTFIGRGENVYTYSNTTRSGTLSFMMLTDHPSITDYASWHYGVNDDVKIEDDIWNRFFAGCDSLDSNDKDSLLHYVSPTPKDYMFERKEETVQQEVDKPSPMEEEKPSDSIEEVTFFTFFPNYYTGREGTLFNPEETQTCDFAIGYLLGGVNAQKVANTQFDDYISFNFSDSTAFKRGYEMSMVRSEGITDLSTTETQNNCIKGNAFNWRFMSMSELEGKVYTEDASRKWYYRIDGRYLLPQNNRERITNQYSHILKDSNRYKDTASYGLNLNIEGIDGDLCRNKENLYSFAEMAYAFAQYMPNCEGVSSYLSSKLEQFGRNEKIEELVKLFDSKIESVEIIGYANSQGYTDENKLLAENRAKTILSWLKWCFGDIPDSQVNISSQEVQIGSDDENSKEAKKWRSVKCTIKFATETEAQNNKNNEEFENIDSQTIKETAQATGVSYGQIKQELMERGLMTESDDLTLSAEDLKYMYDKMKADENRVTQGKVEGRNKMRYDNEMFFYKKYQTEHPLQWKALSDKLQYFDPAYHSMTPEGFNMRLTFLEQCTRQGDTISASDINAGTRVASNMAFGRPPFCVLRLGDFYNQLIVIKSITKNYDNDGALMWDLNDEGIGAQPMICHVTISFDFIGGSDLAGPVRRLQNAMSFNYYANASLYDNRADRMYYESEEHLSTAMGGNQANREPSLPRVGKNGRILDKKGTYSVFHSVAKDDSTTKDTTTVS